MLRNKQMIGVVEPDAILPTKFGTFRIRAFNDHENNKEHALLFLLNTIVHILELRPVEWDTY